MGEDQLSSILLLGLIALAAYGLLAIVCALSDLAFYSRDWDYTRDNPFTRRLLPLFPGSRALSNRVRFLGYWRIWQTIAVLVVAVYLLNRGSLESFALILSAPGVIGALWVRDLYRNPDFALGPMLHAGGFIGWYERFLKRTLGYLGLFIVLAGVTISILEKYYVFL
jgi:hypothetical protein